MDTMYFFPQKNKDIKSNSYSINYLKALSHYFEIVNENEVLNHGFRFALLKNSTIADIYVLNWIEAISSGMKGFVLFLYSLLAIIIILVRNKKIIWMFHNIHPHEGENIYSRVIQKILFRKSALIITHSKEAEKYVKTKTDVCVLYRPHPIKRFLPEQLVFDGNVKYCDVFIWGGIFPYKGVAEFLSNPQIQKMNLKIRIVGTCVDSELDKRIKKLTNSNVVYENRRASFGEIAKQVCLSKYVLFPYVGNSISSSGALIDTLVFGGTPVGPDKGAFKDLAEEGVCITYKNEEDLASILRSAPQKLKVEKFISDNTWEKFARVIWEFFQY